MARFKFTRIGRCPARLNFIVRSSEREIALFLLRTGRKSASGGVNLNVRLGRRRSLVKRNKSVRAKFKRGGSGEAAF